MKLKTLFVSLICIIIGVVGVVLLVNFYKTSPQVYYRGEVIFHNVEEYQGFKEYLIQPEIEILSTDVLASEPPIWVRYTALVPRNWAFPYSYKSTSGRVSEGVQVGLLFMIVLGFGIGIGTGTYILEDK